MEGRYQDLLDALRTLAEEKKQARVTHVYRVVKRYALAGLRYCSYFLMGLPSAFKSILLAIFTRLRHIFSGPFMVLPSTAWDSAHRY